MMLGYLRALRQRIPHALEPEALEILSPANADGGETRGQRRRPLMR